MIDWIDCIVPIRSYAAAPGPAAPCRTKTGPYKCDTCGDRACKKKWRAVCWIHCGRWKPEVLPLDKLPEERGSAYKRQASEHVP